MDRQHVMLRIDSFTCRWPLFPFISPSPLQHRKSHTTKFDYFLGNIENSKIKTVQRCPETKQKITMKGAAYPTRS